MILAVLLSACGFHLRGDVEVPEWLSNVAIITKTKDKELTSILKTQLEGYKIEVNSEPFRAKYWLIINNSNFQQQIVSVGASTNPRQYQLILTVEFLLQAREGRVIQAPKKITITRQLTVNNDRILGSNNEESILISEMKQDAVIQIINRLAH